MSKKKFKNNHQLSCFVGHPESPTCRTVYRCVCVQYRISVNTIDNRIFIRGEFRQSLSMNFFSPFQPEREFKVYKSCKCSQIICSRVVSTRWRSGFSKMGELSDLFPDTPEQSTLIQYVPQTIHFNQQRLVEVRLFFTVSLYTQRIEYIERN